MMEIRESMTLDEFKYEVTEIAKTCFRNPSRGKMFIKNSKNDLFQESGKARVKSLGIKDSMTLEFCKEEKTPIFFGSESSTLRTVMDWSEILLCLRM